MLDMTFALSYIVFGGLLCGFAGVVIAEALSARKRSRREWHDLVAGLRRVDFAGVSEVALDYLTPQRGQIDLEPSQIWDSLGGYEGLKKMRENSEIMLELAAYAQRWNFEEAVIVTERMRHDAVMLRRAIRRVKLGLLPIRLFRRFRFTLPLHAQEACSAYYLMRQRLLSLYETSHECRYPALVASL
jgi:hypothetical protein